MRFVTQTHCRYGHDIAVVGRYSNGRCKACDKSTPKTRAKHAAYMRQRRSLGPLRFPSQPFLRLVDVVEPGRLTQRDWEYIAQLRSNPDRQMNWKKADEMATKLGHHVSNIWPEWYA